MIDLLQDALELQAFCDRRGWSSCIIGGLAVQRWSEPRVTRDVDVALLTGFGKEEAFIETQLQPLAEAREAPEILASLARIRAGKFAGESVKGYDDGFE